MIDDWKQWAQEFLFLLKEAENAEQEGKTGDTAEQSNRRSTVMGSMTRSYWRGPVRSVQQVGDLPDQVREVVVVKHRSVHDRRAYLKLRAKQGGWS